MYLRDTDFPTLGEVAHQVRDTRSTWSGSSTDVVVRLADDTTEDPDTDREDDQMRRLGTIVLGQHEVPATPQGLQTLAQYYEVPYKFLERVPDDEKQFILDHRIQRTEDTPLVIKFQPDKGLNEAYKATITRLSVADMVERLIEDVFPEEAKVIDWWNTPEDFRLDVVVPEGYDRGIGGDAKVGDFTHGGVRIGQNRKQNLAPWVQPLMFRLACTNGYEIPDYGLRIDTRGVDPFDQIAMLGSEAKRAFDRVESDIEHFYDLRSVKITEDQTGLFRRMTRELGLPDRTIGRMENTLAEVIMAEEEVTMFDLVNHLTNAANDPNLRSATNARRALEQAGGQMISDHSARCTLCKSRLN